MNHLAHQPGLIDPGGRRITYLRLSVTDRCDLRCTYCMAPHTRFVPRPEVLSLEEMARLAEAAALAGVRKIRLTGGEPLVRRGVMTLIEHLGALVADGRLDELTLTTNANHLPAHAAGLAANHIRRINLSLDSLDPGTYRALTRGGDLGRALAGLAAAERAGLAVRLNCVAGPWLDLSEATRLVRFAAARGHAVAFIETMPLGPQADAAPGPDLAPLAEHLKATFDLRPTPADNPAAGPARWLVGPGGTPRVGLIVPSGPDFCAACNRLRLTATGRLHPCLGHPASHDLKPLVRAGADLATLARALAEAVRAKPAHHLMDSRPPDHQMNHTGG
ncbi:GTP 3',8-cyclase MoaA [Roseospirillum parvum]|uniref:GTP 3',8-cyclase n=1 Tax=Roseospirillum parvum TaxID=83401 RepID=A0A1G8CN03_9PROT|nr:GTP 3',8-cyclase MoaA [Roseospirillum parvum]SDH46683.1 cyclic pyranopterin phosphate synthase [Roseospirillum parvum]